MDKAVRHTDRQDGQDCREKNLMDKTNRQTDRQTDRQKGYSYTGFDIGPLTKKVVQLLKW